MPCKSVKVLCAPDALLIRMFIPNVTSGLFQDRSLRGKTINARLKTENLVTSVLHLTGVREVIVVRDSLWVTVESEERWEELTQQIIDRLVEWIGWGGHTIDVDVSEQQDEEIPRISAGFQKYTNANEWRKARVTSGR